MDQVGNGKVKHHGAQQAEQCKVQGETFVMLLEKFVAHQKTCQNENKNKGCQGTTALEVADHQGAKHTAKKELQSPGKTSLPCVAPFAFQQLVAGGDGAACDEFAFGLLRFIFGGYANLRGYGFCSSQTGG